MIKNSTKIFKCLFFSLILLITLGFNQTIQAQPAPSQPAGSGTEVDPYQIATLANLYWIAATDAVVASPTRLERWSAHYIQTADIDASSTSTWFSGRGWIPIGNGFSGYNFYGSYNGDNHTISGLYVNDNYVYMMVGLFGYLSGNSSVRNLGVINVNFYGSSSAGGIAGTSDGSGIRTLENVYSTGVISSGSSAGGLVGGCGNCQISNSYSRAAVTGGDYGYSGGLVGQIFNTNASISNSYSTGAVSGTAGAGATTKGGLAGRNSNGTVTNSFYDSQTSGMSDDTGKGTPKTTAEMKTQSTFTDAGWDFASTWTFCSSLNNGYPILTSFTGEITSVAPAGSGTVGAPYQIATLANLKWITESSARWASHYIQTADIDASSTASWNCGEGWSPIGNISPQVQFTGVYDGGGYDISGLTINRPASDTYNGLFGHIGSGGSVSNLGVTQVNIIGKTSGAVVGFCESCTINNAHSSGTIQSSSASAGGLVGAANGSTVSISNSYSSASVHSTGTNAGGLVGQANNSSKVIKSFSTGTVSGTAFIAGGIVGNLGSSAQIQNCYSLSSVSGQLYVGGGVGLVGGGSTIIESYSIGLVSGSGSNVGGFIGFISGTSNTLTNNFWDTETSGLSTSGGATGKTTAQMKTQSTFTSWDFTSGTGDWNINPTGYISYPYLQGISYDVPEATPAVNPIPGLVVAAHTSYTWTGGTDSDGEEPGNWSGGMPPAGADIVIPESATPYPVFSSNMNLGNVTIEPNATLTMAPSFRLDITEDSNITIGAGGKLILKSDGTGTAYIGALSGTSAITGTVLQERYIMGDNRSFRFMGHPFTTAIPLSALGDKIDITGSGTGFTPTATNNPSAFYYNPATGDADTENDGGWTSFTSMTDNWNRYQGIRVLVRGSKGQSGSFDDVEYTPDPVTFEWEGEVNTGTQTINLVYASPSGGVSDFNLIGNPYPSAIDLKAITRSGSVGTTFYTWQPRASTSGTSGRGGAYLAEPFTTGPASYTLPTGGAFFVRAGAVGQSLTIEESDKVNSNEPLQGTAGSTLRMDSNVASKYGSNSLQLVLSSEGEWWDRSLVFFDAATANSSQDQQDATKLANPEVNFFTVSSDDFAMAIDSRPYQEAKNNLIPLHIQSPARAYTLSLPDFDLEEGRSLRLYDRFTEEYITLEKGTSYDFEVTEDLNSKGHRFDIVMGIEVITSINPTNSRFQAFLLPNPAQEQVRISIQTPDNTANTRVRIVSMTGVEVSNKVLTTATSELDVNLSQLSKGIYLVEITHGTERIVKRLIVN